MSTPAPSSLAIDVAGLSKSFEGKRVVDDFGIRVPRGTICGFLGPNGSGKTTTIRMLCGLLTPDAGSGTCLGFDLHREQAAIKRRVGYMTQRFSLYEELSLEENLDFIARVYAVPQRRQAVAQALAGLGLSERFGPTRRRALRRLEAAACARGLPDPRPRTALARRADRGSRSQGETGILGSDSRSRRARADRAGQHALHG
jgi:ABC-2 type transport system ATP-binding protein